MQRWSLRIGLAVVVLGMVIQFIPIARTNPPVETDIPTSPEVKMVLRRACYDCHSHETVWPWYSHVAPLSWLVAHDVSEGRDELNFSTWNRYNPQEQRKKLNKSWEEVQEGAMPPWLYKTPHPAARLSPQDLELLRQWAQPHDAGTGAK